MLSLYGIFVTIINDGDSTEYTAYYNLDDSTIEWEYQGFLPEHVVYAAEREAVRLSLCLEDRSVMLLDDKYQIVVEEV